MGQIMIRLDAKISSLSIYLYTDCRSLTAVNSHKDGELQQFEIRKLEITPGIWLKSRQMMKQTISEITLTNGVKRQRPSVCVCKPALANERLLIMHPSLRQHLASPKALSVTVIIQYAALRRA